MRILHDILAVALSLLAILVLASNDGLKKKVGYRLDARELQQFMCRKMGKGPARAFPP
jgi:hypothetical protein